MSDHAADKARLLQRIDENRRDLRLDLRALRDALDPVTSLVGLAHSAAALFLPIAGLAETVRRSTPRKGGLLLKLATWLPIALPLIKLVARRR